MLHATWTGSGPVVGFVHGFTQTRRSWDQLINALEDSYSCVAVDLPGHGLSSGRVPPFAQTAAQVAETVGRAIYVGYSMGARLCMRAALDRHDLVRGLVLIGATAGIDDPGERSQRLHSDAALATRLQQVGLSTFLDEWLAQPMFGALSRARESYRLESSAEGIADALVRLGTGAMEPMWRQLSTIHVPTLLIAGGDDLKFRALGARIQELIPGSGLEVIDGAGHAPHLERPELVTGLIRAFLEETARPDRP